MAEEDVRGNCAMQSILGTDPLSFLFQTRMIDVEPNGTNNEIDEGLYSRQLYGMLR